MHKLLKYTLIISVTLVIVMVLGTVAITTLIDPNYFKKPIQETLNQKTGKYFAIEDIKWKIFPRPALTLSQVKITNSKDSTNWPLVTIKKIDVNLKLTSLFNKIITADKINLYKADINLVKNAKGQYNWASISSPTVSPTLTPPPQENSSFIQKNSPSNTSPLQEQKIKLVVNEVNLIDSKITLQDKKLNQFFILAFNKIALKSVNNEEFLFNLQLDQLSVTDKQTGITADLNIKTQVHFNPLEDTLFLNGLMGSGSLSSSQFIFKQPAFLKFSTDLTANFKEQQISLDQLFLSLNDLKIKGMIKSRYNKSSNKFLSKLVIEPFNPKQFLKNFNVNLVTPQSEAFTLMQGKFNVNVSKENYALQLYDTYFDNNKVDGQIILKDKNLKFLLALNQLNVNHYFPLQFLSLLPSSPTLSNSPSSVSFKPKNALPLPSNKNLPTSVAFSKWLDYTINGRVTCQALYIYNIPLKNVITQITGQQGIIDLETTHASLYQGKHLNKVTLNLKNSPLHLAMSEKLEGVAIQPLLKDLFNFNAIEGVGALNANLVSSGNNLEEIKHFLNGNATLAVRQGTLKGINLAQAVALAFAKFKNKSVDIVSTQTDTSFSELTASFAISHGIAQNKDLKLITPLFTVLGKGSIHLINQQVNYDIEIFPKNESVKPLALLIEQAGGAIPFKVTGTFSNPHVEPNILLLVKRIAQKKLVTPNNLKQELKAGTLNLEEMGKKLKSLFKNE